MSIRKNMRILFSMADTYVKNKRKMGENVCDVSFWICTVAV